MVSCQAQTRSRLRETMGSDDLRRASRSLEPHWRSQTPTLQYLVCVGSHKDGCGCVRARSANRFFGQFSQLIDVYVLAQKGQATGSAHELIPWFLRTCRNRRNALCTSSRVARSTSRLIRSCRYTPKIEPRFDAVLHRPAYSAARPDHFPPVSYDRAEQQLAYARSQKLEP